MADFDQIGLDESAEGSFNNPAFGHYLEAFNVIGTPNNLQFAFALQRISAGAVGLNDFEPSASWHEDDWKHSGSVMVPQSDFKRGRRFTDVHQGMFFPFLATS